MNSTIEITTCVQQMQPHLMIWAVQLVIGPDSQVEGGGAGDPVQSNHELCDEDFEMETAEPANYDL